MRARARAILLFVVALAAVGGAATLGFRDYAARRLEQSKARFEAEAGSLDPASYAPEQVEREHNAAVWLSAGIEAAGLATQQSELVTRRTQALGSPWTAEDEAGFDALIAKLEPARAQMDRAVGLERSSLGIDYSSMELVVPDLMPWVGAARVLAVHCDLALQRGEVDEAIADVALLERMAAVMRREPLTITLLIGGALERFCYDCVEAVLADVHTLPQIDRLQADLDHLERSAASLRSVLAREGAWLHLVMSKWASEERAKERSSSWLEQWLGEPVRKARALLGVDWLLAANRLEAAARLARHAEEPIAGLEAPELFERELDESSRWLHDPTTMIVLPNLVDAIHKDQRTTSARRLAHTALRLRRERLERGAYPARLPDPPTSDYAGDIATYRLLDDGGAEIAFVESENAWTARHAAFGPGPWQAPNLTWSLPP